MESRKMKNEREIENFKDPVCGMVVSQSTAPAACEHEGKTYYFCSDICRDKFDANPDKYINKWPKQEH
jgi:YHS domain-containing protein